MAAPTSTQLRPAPGAIGARAAHLGQALLDDPRPPATAEQDAATRAVLEAIAGAAAAYAIDGANAWLIDVRHLLENTARQAALIALHAPTTYVCGRYLVAPHLLDDAPVLEHFLRDRVARITEQAAVDGLGLVTRPRAGWRVPQAETDPRFWHANVPAWVPPVAYGLVDEPTDDMRERTFGPLEFVVWAAARPLIDTPPTYRTPL